jgi:hypothetical protein
MVRVIDMLSLLEGATSAIENPGDSSSSRGIDAKSRFKQKKLVMIKNDGNGNPSERQKYMVNPAGPRLFPIFSDSDILDLDR